jgi:hypothetical protein
LGEDFARHLGAGDQGFDVALFAEIVGNAQRMLERVGGLQPDRVAALVVQLADVKPFFLSFVRPWSITNAGIKWSWISGSDNPGWVHKKPLTSAIGDVPGTVLARR